MKDRLDDPLLTLKELQERKLVPYSRSQIYKMIKAKTFPAPYKPSPSSKKTLWHLSVIVKWQEESIGPRDAASFVGAGVRKVKGGWFIKEADFQELTERFFYWGYASGGVERAQLGPAELAMLRRAEDRNERTKQAERLNSTKVL